MSTEATREQREAFAVVDNAGVMRNIAKGGVSLRPETMSGKDLLELDIADTKFLCRPWIPEGVTILAGRPKIGKTTLLRMFAAAVSNNSLIWNKETEKAKVLFLSLEEGIKLMRKKLLAMDVNPAQAAAIEFSFKWPQGSEGCNYLRQHLSKYPDTRLIIIDSLTRFRESQSREKSPFVQDYEAVCALAEIAKLHQGLSIIVLHHTTKITNPDDPIADISGTFGLTAAADNYMVLRKQGNDFVLHCGGRYWEEEQDAFILDREGGKWVLRGAHDGVHLTQMQSKYLAYVAGRTDATTRSAAVAMGVGDSTASELLSELEQKGMVTRTETGWQATPSGRLRATVTTETERTERGDVPKTPKDPNSPKNDFGDFGTTGTSGTSGTSVTSGTSALRI